MEGLWNYPSETSCTKEARFYLRYGLAPTVRTSHLDSAVTRCLMPFGDGVLMLWRSWVMGACGLYFIGSGERLLG